MPLGEGKVALVRVMKLTLLPLPRGSSQREKDRPRASSLCSSSPRTGWNEAHATKAVKGHSPHFAEEKKKKNKGTEPGMPWGAEGLDLPDNSSLPLEAWSG